MAKKARSEDEGQWGPETLNQKMLEILHRAGVRPEIIYAFQKTGRMSPRRTFTSSLRRTSRCGRMRWTRGGRSINVIQNRR